VLGGSRLGVFRWTPGSVKLLLSPRQSRGISRYCLTEEEYQQFEKDLVELTKDSPKVQVASIRFKKVMGKVGNSIASSVREIVVDVLSEAAKKALWG